MAVRNKILLESFRSITPTQRRFKLESQTLARGQIFRDSLQALAVSYRNSTCFRIQHLPSWLLAYLLQGEVTKQWAADPASSMHVMKQDTDVEVQKEDLACYSL
jgi:hypothetical protein